MKDTRQPMGYRGGDKTKPIYPPQWGEIVLNAFISCSQCNKHISAQNGPALDAWCIECTEDKS